MSEILTHSIAGVGFSFYTPEEIQKILKILLKLYIHWPAMTISVKGRNYRDHPALRSESLYMHPHAQSLSNSYTIT